MKLQRLELFGFKSFADRVSIEFNPGITAIVGPNGCGKSNISDAVRWVLGEQRPTLIRGSKMEEVIFNGSRERKPINLAEVTLRFANEDGLLPVDYSEVAVTRRVFREGVSEYLLNRQLCRLKDVQDLFMGTGVGAHAYSLIQQGTVDSLLSDRTEERRTIFEEAAGVTRYKSRRRAAERKLEATAHDLERVQDIVGEVEKTVASLRRQVGKARRYRAFEAEETRLDAHVTARALAELAELEAPLLERLRRLETDEAEHAARLAALEVEIASLELALVERREGERAAREEAEAIRLRIARREESRLVTGESIKHDRRRREELAAESERAVGRAEELAGRRAALETDRAAARERLAGIVTRLAPGAEAADEETRVAELRAERAATAAALEDLRERLAETSQMAARQATAAEAAGERLAVLTRALEAAGTEREAARAGLVEAGSALEAVAGETAAAAASVEAARRAAREAGERAAAAREALAAERAAERAAAGRHETLAAMEARYEGYAGGVRALLAGRVRIEGLAGALPQAIEPCEPRFEPPLERYLETLGHGLLVRDREAAVAAADRLEAEGGGRADFLIPEFLANGPVPAMPDEAAAVVLARGTDAVRWTRDDGLRDRLAPLFQRLLIVADRTAAFRCRTALSEAPEACRHYVIAGLDGTLLEPTGRWGTGAVDGDEGLLARRRRRAEAEAEVAARRHALTRLEEELAGAEGAVRDAEERVEAAVAAADVADRRHRAARETRVAAEGAAAEAERRVAELEAQTAEQSVARDRGRSAAADLAETKARLEADVERARERHAGVSAALERHEAARIDRQSARHAVELERAQAEAELRAIEREIEHVASGEARLEDARRERRDETARLEASIERLESERAATAEEVEGLNAELDAVLDRLRQDEAAVRESEERRSALEAESRGLRHRHDQAAEARHEAALARQDLEFRRGALREHASEAWDAELDDVLARHPLTEAEGDLGTEELEARLEEVRRKRLNLGPVNMLAVEEFERESERLEFLTSQRDDLVRAKRQLEDAIRRINGTARDLFERTFTDIRENFDTTFRTLFEGGHAEVRLEDPDDPLESPIEIVASPRGKRVQHISLLSGGERALAALALLFAIYQVKPSPFCILDEVDAPLDDANVGRFIRMIRHFSDRTQFVVITHNKRTMEAADYLYGVTMEEPGISTLVSVALEGSAEESANGQGNGSGALARRSLDEVWAAAGR